MGFKGMTPDDLRNLLQIHETFARMREEARGRRVVLVLPDGEIVDTGEETPEDAPN